MAQYTPNTPIRPARDYSLFSTSLSTTPQHGAAILSPLGQSPSGPQSDSLVDMRAINAIIKRQVETEIAPLRAENAALQAQVADLSKDMTNISGKMTKVEEGLAAAGKPHLDPDFQEVMFQTFMRALDRRQGTGAGLNAHPQGQQDSAGNSHRF